jgi:hypothetical protein
VSTQGAIAGVTAVLQQVLTDRVSAAVNGAIVTARPLDKAQPTEGKSVLNLFLFQAVTNGAFSNLPMPGTNPAIDDRPPVALNLHYLLTVFGKDDTDEAPVEGHLLLGAALRALLDQPSLKRSDIRKFAPNTGLDHQVDLIRLTPKPMTTDDVSKLWTAFQAPYRLSTAIEASCVLIETRPPKPTPLPVVKRGSDDRGPEAVAHKPPLIERLTFGLAERPLPAALVGEDIHAIGQGLTPPPGQSAVLRVESTDGQRSMDVPLSSRGEDLDGTLAGLGWRAGTYRASVVHLDNGSWAMDSPDVPMAVAPRIDRLDALAPGNRLPDDQSRVVLIDAGASDGVLIEITVAPPIEPGQAIEAQWRGQHLQRTDPPATTPQDKVVFRARRPPETPIGATTPASPIRLRVANVDSLPFDYVDRAKPANGFEIDPTQQVQIRWA